MAYTDKLRVVYGDYTLGVHGEGFDYIFSYAQGGLESIVKNGYEWLYRCPKPTFWRALTDNDRGSKFHIKSGSWLSADMFIDCKETQVIMDGEVQKPYAPDNNSFGGDVFADEIIVKYTYETISNPSTTVLVTYTVDVSGKIQVDVHYNGVKGLPEIPVFGMRFIMPTLADKYIYKGLSGETYPDRKAGAQKGIYEVTDLSLTPYLVPQECGMRMLCNKAQAGHEEDIRPCIGCLRCLNGIMFGKRVACTVNPSLEPENEDTITPAKETKNVLVIGGGPAGMEAAYVAAKRGHHVVLADRQDSLGGTVRIAAVPIAKQDLTQLIKYQAHKLEQAGVKVLLNTEVTLETIQKDYPDYEVILCAGATPVVPQFMTQFKDWMTADDVLYGRKFPGRKIVVIGGGSVGCETADYLAPVLNDRFPRNREITLIEMAHEIMEAESGPGRSLLVQRMMEKGIQILCDAKVEEVNHTVIKYTKDGKTHEITDADTLVLAMGYRPSNTLEEQLTSAGITCHVLGDCKKPGNIKDAVTEGYQTALNL